jgi:hypothetical protein
MATTSLIIEDKIQNVTKYIQVYTQPDEEEGTGVDGKGYGSIVVFYDMDPEFEFVQGSDRGKDARDEETYHKELRAAAALQNQLITSHSTDPEWNPEGYKKNLYDTIYAYECEACNEDWVSEGVSETCTNCLSTNINRKVK